uniref:Uncharacterized protein n=1 Tax=Arundo donax TaxID=35708 RepID=A0A0A8YYU1_ARUDO
MESIVRVPSSSVPSIVSMSYSYMPCISRRCRSSGWKWLTNPHGRRGSRWIAPNGSLMGYCSRARGSNRSWVRQYGNSVIMNSPRSITTISKCCTAR